MLSQTIINLINQQINKEIFSAYLYQDFANYYDVEGLSGFANWFTVQVQEELDHVKFFSRYLLNHGVAPALQPIMAPEGRYEGFMAPLRASLEHEKSITASIYALNAQALEEKDFRTIQFLDWFIKEQGEEEKNADDLIKKYELFGQDGKGLYLLDSELQTRVYTPPTFSI